MRQEDKDEIWHLARFSPSEALAASYNSSHYIRTVLLDGAVVCSFGCAKNGSLGVPWMLASPLLSKISRQFLRECRDHLDEMSEGCTQLYNLAWSKNTTHLNWLKWLGFTMQEGLEMGPDNEIYIPFFKVNSNV